MPVIDHSLWMLVPQPRTHQTPDDRQGGGATLALPPPLVQVTTLVNGTIIFQTPLLPCVHGKQTISILHPVSAGRSCSDDAICCLIPALHKPLFSQVRLLLLPLAHASSEATCHAQDLSSFPAFLSSEATCQTTGLPNDNSLSNGGFLPLNTVERLPCGQTVRGEGGVTVGVHTASGWRFAVTWKPGPGCALVQ